MSLSLSSLLNPSPDADTQTSPAAPRKEYFPPLQHAQSPEQQFAPSPQLAQQPQQRYNYPPSTEQDAVQALAALSNSNASPTFQPSWYGQQTSQEPSYERRSSSYDRRPGSSGYNEPMQLPPPPPSSTGRKMSSPTLEQYHVASRSPEQRRASIISPAQSSFTLPPIHSIGASHTDHTQRPSSSHAHPAQHTHAHPMASHTDTSTAFTAAPAERQQSGTYEQSIQQATTALPNQQSSPSHLHVTTSGMSAPNEIESSPAAIKQEAVMTPRTSSPIEARRMSVQGSDGEVHSAKAVASLKHESSMRTNSPLRESSVPVPSTELSVPEPSVPKKRPAPSKTKKGMATTTKKAPPAKKRKVEVKRSVTPSSRASKPPTLSNFSGKGTPANSSPAPSTRSQSQEPNDEAYDDDEDMEDGDIDDNELYCICRKPDSGTFMIGCDGTCDDWFHGKCVGIEERNKALLDKYICPSCTKAGAGLTTWKRMCRRHGCRQPARVGKTKNGKDGSKYCSEECGVMYFREMVAHTRGREDTMKHRSNRRKASIVSNERPAIDDDLGARGSVLSAGELKGLVNSSKTAEDFQKLGEGVLSPPATPDANSPNHKSCKESTYTESESQALEEITRQKDEARNKHQLLKDRTKFVTMVKQAAARTAAEKELKTKEYCGYDSRLEWSAQQFSAWRNGSIGRQAFELDTLATEKSGPTDKPNEDLVAELDDGSQDFEICDRKKCPRHLEWAKLHMDDVRSEMTDNGDHMRALDREERELRERAALRGKAGGSLSGEGSVEVHRLGISVDEEAGKGIEEPAAAETGATEAMAVDAVA